MLSNHNKNQSSFRIIEPKQFQQAQQIPVQLSSQQIPILTIKNASNNNFTSSSNTLNDLSTNNKNIQFHNQYHQHHQQQQQHQHQAANNQQQYNHHHHHHHHHRSRNLSDTDSSYIPGKFVI